MEATSIITAGVQNSSDFRVPVTDISNLSNNSSISNHGQGNK